MSIFFYARQHSNIFRELDIISWEFRYPVVLNDVMSVQLWMQLRLLLISDVAIPLNDPLVNDVLRVMRIDVKEICILTENQIDTLVLPSGFSCHSWWIGIMACRDFYGICLCTPSLSILKDDVKVKRNLWYQISQNYENFM